MPKPRLSYEQARMRGATAANPGRFASRKDAPATVGELGPAPDRLVGEAAEVWEELAQAIPAGVAGRSDRLFLEMTVRLMCESRSSFEGMSASRLSLLTGMLSKLGMDPQGRTRLKVKLKGETDADRYAWLTK